MTSFLAAVGNYFSGVHIYGKLYDTPEFKEFHSNLSKQPLDEGVVRMITNFICWNLDPLVEKSITSPEMNAVFRNKSFSKGEQAKLFIGNLIKQTCASECCFVSVNVEAAIELAFGMLSRVNGIEKITNGKDVYTLLINEFATFMGKDILPWISSVGDRIDPEMIATYFMGLTNSVYSYDSKNLNTRLLNRTNDSDSDSDTETTVELPPINSSNKGTQNNKRKADSGKPPMTRSKRHKYDSNGNHIQNKRKADSSNPENPHMTRSKRRKID